MSARKATGSVIPVAWMGSLGLETMSQPAGDGDAGDGDCRRSGGRRKCRGLTEITKVLKCKLFNAPKQADDTAWIFRSLL